MKRTSQDEAHRFAILLNAAIKACNLYPPAHRAVRQPLEELISLLDALLLGYPTFIFGIGEDVLFCEDFFFVSPSTASSDLVKRLNDKGVDAVTISNGVEIRELSAFIALVADRESDMEGMKKSLGEQGVRNIRFGIHREGDDRKVYREAMEAVRDVVSEIENGRIPGSRKINMVVTSMVTMAMRDHSALLGLSMIKDYDNYTFNHCVNVGILALALGVHIGLGKEDLRTVNMAGLLHDIGKIKIDKAILCKPGKLTDNEFAEMTKHPWHGAEIVTSMKGMNAQMADAVLGHHIRYNRKGYPDWARDREFGIPTEILAVADSYDAMTTLRPYSPAKTPKAAIDIMRQEAGSQFDADLFESFTEMMGKYPVGALIRLDSNEIAVVVKSNFSYPEYPVVKIIADAQGNMLQTPVNKDLSRNISANAPTIVASVDPMLKNIDTSRYVH